MEHRLTSVSLIATTTDDLFDQTLNNIDKKLIQSYQIFDQNTANTPQSIEFVRLYQLKQDIIHQVIQTGHEMIAKLARNIYDEKQHFFRNQNADHHTAKMEADLYNAIEVRRSHMTERAKYLTNHKIKTNFTSTTCAKQDQN